MKLMIWICCFIGVAFMWLFMDAVHSARHTVLASCTTSR